MYGANGEIKSGEWWISGWKPGEKVRIVECKRRRGHRGECHSDGFGMKILRTP
jgi:hypothetical protein